MTCRLNLLVWQLQRHDSISTHQLWRGPVSNMLGGIPFLIAFPVVPEGAAKVVLGEEELLGRPLAQGRKDAVVADQGLELSSEIVPLDPV